MTDEKDPRWMRLPCGYKMENPSSPEFIESFNIWPSCQALPAIANEQKYLRTRIKEHLLHAGGTCTGKHLGL